MHVFSEEFWPLVLSAFGPLFFFFSCWCFRILHSCFLWKTVVGGAFCIWLGVHTERDFGLRGVADMPQLPWVHRNTYSRTHRNMEEIFFVVHSVLSKMYLTFIENWML